MGMNSQIKLNLQGLNIVWFYLILNQMQSMELEAFHTVVLKQVTNKT